MELTVWDISLEDELARVVLAELDVEEAPFSHATRCAVTGSKADIYIGGRWTGDLGFRGSVEDNVYKDEEHDKGKDAQAYLATFSTH